MTMHRACALYAASGGDEAALLAKYGTLIDRIARRLAMRIGMPSAFDDLWSAGSLGLLEAAKRFDPARDVRFESFAEHRIRGAMLDELRRMDHLPRRLRAQTDKLAKARHQLCHELSREPSPEELAVRLGMDLGGLGEIELQAMPHMPLAPDLAAAAGEEPQDETLAKSQLVEFLQKAIAQLPLRLQTLMSLHYVEGLTYREIAEIMQVSEPRICQLHGEAIGKIRALMAASQGEAIPEPPPSPKARRKKTSGEAAGSAPTGTEG
ncbi:MAG: FliA/WhiG family RNA polymerase sigma factor [Deltaproteobacteria bacterium]|nr:FliA/WhiG family RNA polymerase sigma factor [Deltaproteobacteria bacterium]